MGEIVRMDNGKDNEIMAMMNDASLCPLLEETKVGVSNYTKLPVTRLATMGTAFQPLTTAVQTAVTGAGGSGLYYVNTAGKTMFQMKETGNFIGSLKTSAGLVGGGQAQMMPLAFDPTMLFMAAALANIDKKLDSIKEMQQEMMDFLVQKEKAELKGNLTFLYDVFNNYKYNWNNEMYKNSNHTMVLAIKKEAEAKIVFYREQIIAKVNKKFLIHSDQTVNKQLQAVQDQFKDYHRKLFRGIYKHAGKIRDYNITKKEWVLDGATVMYGSASELRETLEYDFSQERDFSYKGLSMDEIIHHLAVFVSRLWQIHIFGEGNTRTTAVFFIKYFGTLGFSVTNDIFAENAWYFRNALVRANYTNLQKGIHETTEYLEAFLRNLLLNEKNELHNRNLHISGLLNEEKVDIGDSKVDIENEKVDIQETKVDIESVLSEKGSDFSVKTTVHIHRLFKKFGFDEVFGRSAVMELLELKGSGASKLLSNLVQADIIEPVSGHGKGKYKFKM